MAIRLGDGPGQFVTRLFKLDPELPSQLNCIAEAQELSSRPFIFVHLNINERLVVSMGHPDVCSMVLNMQRKSRMSHSLNLQHSCVN